MPEHLDPMLPSDDSPNGREPMLPSSGIVSSFQPLPPIEELLVSLRDVMQQMPRPATPIRIVVTPEQLAMIPRMPVSENRNSDFPVDCGIPSVILSVSDANETADETEPE